MTDNRDGRFLYLENSDLVQGGLHDWPCHLQAIENSFRQIRREGEALMLKPRLQLPDVRSRWTGYIAYLGPSTNRVSLKWLTRLRTTEGVPRPIEGLLVLSDAVTGDVLAVMQGSGVTATRTAVTSALGCIKLARRDATILSVLGAGVIGQYHVRALRALMPQLKTVVVWNRHPERAADLVSQEAEAGGSFLVLAETVEDAVSRADIIVCAFGGGEPRVRAHWIQRGTLVVDVGETTCDTDVVRCADRVFVDWKGRSLGSGSQALDRAVAAGLFSPECVSGDIADVVVGSMRRESDDHMIYLSSIGLPAEDLAVASVLYDSALRRGLGIWLPLKAGVGL